ncbi:MAG TPA: hypothetical protein VFJ16_27240 [Longimicrobium sp.]|nr:hypothetical protein [Longimicrobium sp.]
MRPMTWFSPAALEIAVQRMQSCPSLLERLSPENRAFVLAWDGPESSGSGTVGCHT